MTARSHVSWQVLCDAPSCGAQDYYDSTTTRAQARRLMAKRGWTTSKGHSPSNRKDYCPEHKAP